MTQPAKASEPSMEDILASIRRIIADDDTTKLAQPELEASRIATAATLFGEQSTDIREVTEVVTAPTSRPAAPRAAPIPKFRATDGACDGGFVDVAEKSAAPGKPDEAQLLSRETSAAVDAAFNTLAQTVLVSSPRTLEDLVREMLRPMLKSWLDENLPRLVERLVRAEIERVARRSRA
jgi:cell pole-organizing protein PopZ